MLKTYSPQDALNTILARQPLDDLPIPPSLQASLERLFGETITPDQAVTRILADVRRHGDAALHEWTVRLDGGAPEQLAVPAEELKTALDRLPGSQRDALELAAERIRRFHAAQPVTSWLTQSLGGTLGQLVRPIGRIGLYIPAGSAPLPSTVLMSAIPAQVAGVSEIVLVSPPQRGSGHIAPIILAAACLLGLEEIYVLGGAQAIAALAYGTASIRPVDKIFGPGQPVRHPGQATGIRRGGHRRLGRPN